MQQTNLEKLSVKEMREIQLDILNDVNDFCTKNNILYFLAYGTLIGAIRHKGYIPWDDDIDIVMTRPNYNKFIANYHSEKYKIINFDVDADYPYVFTKIQDPSTLLVEYSSREFDLGVNIDLFPIDGLSADEKKRSRQIKRISFYSSLKEIKRIKTGENRSFFRNAVLCMLKAAVCFIPYRFIIKQLVGLGCQSDYEQATLVGDLNFISMDRCFPKKGFEEWVDVEFENNTYKAPKCYDLWLKKVYGNYMEFPPKKDQKTHHVFHAYRR
jgi:lipopolysaccharide cholinephosphotransferase